MIDIFIAEVVSQQKKKFLRVPWNVGDWRIKVIFRIRSTFSLSRASERWISAKRTWKIIKLWLELITAFSPYCFCTTEFPRYLHVSQKADSRFIAPQIINSLMGTFAKQKLVVRFLFWAAIFWQKDTSSVPSVINEAVGRSEKKKKKRPSSISVFTFCLTNFR